MGALAPGRAHIPLRPGGGGSHPANGSLKSRVHHGVQEDRLWSPRPSNVRSFGSMELQVNDGHFLLASVGLSVLGVLFGVDEDFRL